MPAQKVPLSAFVTDVVAIVLDEKLAVDPAPLADSVVASIRASARPTLHNLPIGGLFFPPTTIVIFSGQAWKAHFGSTTAIRTRQAPVVPCSPE